MSEIRSETARAAAPGGVAAGGPRLGLALLVQAGTLRALYQYGIVPGLPLPSTPVRQCVLAAVREVVQPAISGCLMATSPDQAGRFALRQPDHLK